jgi:hypothetical protein
MKVCTGAILRSLSKIRCRCEVEMDVGVTLEPEL